MASSSQFIGQLIGSFLSTSVFLSINSVDFCNRFIYTKPRSIPLVSFEQFILLNAIVFFVSVVFILFFKEKRDLGKKL